MCLKLVERGLKVGPTGQLERLILIAEQEVDSAAFDHLRERLLALGDADAFAERETDFPARGVGNLDCLHHGRARLARPEQIAFEEKDRGRRD